MNKIKKIFEEKYIIFNKIAIYFLFLSMSLFLSTDYFPIIEIALGILGIYVLFFCILKKFNPVLHFIKSSFFIWYVIFWLLVIIITYIQNTQALIDLLKTIVVFSTYIFGFGILYSDDKMKSQFKISNMMEIIAVFLSIWILIFEFPLLIQGERIGFSVMIGNPNSAGCLLSAYIFFIIYQITKSEKKKKIIHILELILCFAVVLATGSKKAIIMSVIAFLLLLFKDGHIVPKRVLYFAIIAIIFIAACFTVPTLYDNVGRRFLSLFGELGIIEFQTDHSSELRVTYSESAIELWKQNIFLGGGYDNFRYNSGYNTYSHNNYTELLCSVGIIGTLIYYSYHLYIIKKSIFCGNMESIMCLLFIISILIGDVGAVTFSIYPIYYMILFIISKRLEEFEKKEITSEN